MRFRSVGRPALCPSQPAPVVISPDEPAGSTSLTWPRKIRGFLFGNLWQTRLARAVRGDLDGACARAGLDKIKDQLK